MKLTANNIENIQVEMLDAGVKFDGTKEDRKLAVKYLVPGVPKVSQRSAIIVNVRTSVYNHFSA